MIAHIDADILSLTNFDFDADSLALAAFLDVLMNEGIEYPYKFAPLPNSGRPSDLDLDADGRFGEPEDAVGYGRFWGDGGLVVLSKLPINTPKIRTLSDIVWGDLPTGRVNALPEAHHRLPVSTSGHLIVPIAAPAGELAILVSASTAPIFDGPEDRNGLRNADELALWSLFFAGHFGSPPGTYVLAFNTNLDPIDGDGLNAEMADFLKSPNVIDPMPISHGAVTAADSDHRGLPELDTVDWPDARPGNLRVNYVLPSPNLRVLNAGVFWPDPNDREFEILGSDGLAAGPHRMVWVDVIQRN